MSMEGTIVAAIMLVLGLGWLALPILRRKYFVNSSELTLQKQRDALVTTYERTLASLRDVDEDHLTGKLGDSDYEAERTYWTEQGVAVLQALEKAGGKKPAPSRKSAGSDKAPVVASAAASVASDSDAILDQAIEETIAKYIKSTH